MSDSATPFGTISIGQTDQVVAANSLFDALSPASIYGLDKFSTSGVTLGLFGGKISINGVLTVVAPPSLTLTASTTNYIYADPGTGTCYVGPTSYPAGYWKVGRAVCDANTMTTWYDDRFAGGFPKSETLTKTLPSDANYSLTVDEAANATLEISGTITATRNIVLPHFGKRQWTVYNGTGQSLQFIGASGTGITVATLKHAIVRSNGTNIVRVTADA